MADFVKQGLTEIYKMTLGTEADEVVIGDTSKSGELVPKIEFSKWSGEEKLSIQYEGLIPVASAMVDGTLYMDTAKEGFYFRQHDGDTVKFGLILYEQPKVNSWSFKLAGDWQDMEFAYQPPLTEEYKAGDKFGIITVVTETDCLDKDGNWVVHRPIDVVGGYAVYHKTKKDYIIGQTNYMTGQIGFIYRPKFIDSDGNVQWAVLNIENGVYTVSIDPKWLEKAKYPVKANDTFGYTTAGGTAENTGSNYGYAAQLDAVAPADGTLTNLTWYGTVSASSSNNQYGLFTESSGDPGTQLAGDSNWTRATTAGWYINPVSWSYSMTSGTQYWAAWWCSGTLTCYFNSSGSKQLEYWYNDSGLRSPLLTYEYLTNKHISVYATYTPSGGGGGWVSGGKLKNII